MFTNMNTGRTQTTTGQCPLALKWESRVSDLFFQWEGWLVTLVCLCFGNDCCRGGGVTTVLRQEAKTRPKSP